MPDSLSARTRLHLILRPKLGSGGETELAFLVGLVDRHIAAEQHALVQAFGLRAIDKDFDDFRADGAKVAAVLPTGCGSAPPEQFEKHRNCGLVFPGSPCQLRDYSILSAACLRAWSSA